jgi:hypothetical protein
MNAAEPFNLELQKRENIKIGFATARSIVC